MELIRAAAACRAGSLSADERVKCLRKILQALGDGIAASKGRDRLPVIHRGATAS